jgi:hypothetical protein
MEHQYNLGRIKSRMIFLVLIIGDCHLIMDTIDYYYQTITS